MTIASNTFSVTQSGSSGTTTYTITASAGAGGSISPTGATVNQGASQTFTISPASGYKISNVTVDGTSVGAVSTYTFSNVTANHTISAAFTSTTTATYTISATVTAGGSISPQGATVAKGASQTFTISPSTGYRINNVTVDGASMGAISTYTFSNVTANHSISASFTATTTTTAALSSLTISPAVVKGGTVATGTVTLNAPAPAGGAVVSLSSSALTLWPDLIPKSITIPAGSTRASFAVKTHTPYGEGYVIFTAYYRGVTKQFNLYVLK